jgi:hypothetical protein
MSIDCQATDFFLLDAGPRRRARTRLAKSAFEIRGTRTCNAAYLPTPVAGLHMQLVVHV